MTTIPETHEEVWLNRCPSCDADGTRVPLNLNKGRETAHCYRCDTYWPKIKRRKRQEPNGYSLSLAEE